MAIQLTTQIASVQLGEIIARSGAVAYQASICVPGGPLRSFLAVESLRGRGSLTASWPMEPTQPTAYAVSENDDYDNSVRITLTDTTATVTEKIAICTITDLAAETSLENEVERITRHLGIAHGDKLDATIFALHNALNNDSGSTGQNATWTLLSGARASLRGHNYGPPFLAVLHPQQYDDFATEGTPTLGGAGSVGGIGQDLVLNYDVYRFAGMDIVTSSNIPLANTDADRSGAVYSGRPAIGLAELWWMKLGTERDESARLTEYTMVSAYEAVEINGVAANAFETDA